MELYEVREMMAKELHGILHDEFNAYPENYNGVEGDDQRDIYDIILFYQRDPRELLYIDIAKATAIMRLYETTKKKRGVYKMQLSPTSRRTRKHLVDLQFFSRFFRMADKKILGIWNVR